MLSRRKVECWLILCTWWAYGISAAPTRPPQQHMPLQLNRAVQQTRPLQQNFQVTGTPSMRSLGESRGFKESPRVLASMFGSVFGSIPFLPLNLNVPDSFTGMFSLFQQYFTPEKPTTSRKKKKKKTTTTTTTTTTTAIPKSADLEETYEEESDEEEGNEETHEEQESKRLTIIGNHHNNGISNFDEMLDDYIRRKNELERRKKHKKKRGKHKHDDPDDMLHKIASHLAFLELDC